jgi:hypothetical protein
MKLLSKNLLVEYGFTECRDKSNNITEVMTRNEVDINIKDGVSFYYSNMNVMYPLKDIAALRKLYKELKSEELRPTL